MDSNEYMKVLELYIGIVDILLDRNSSSDSKLCVWSKGNAYANFRPSAFKTILSRQGRGAEYRQLMRNFRTFGWIACQSEKFTKVQWINGKSMRVVSVDYEKYTLIKELIAEGSYENMLMGFVTVVGRLMEIDAKTDKRICLYSQNGKILKVKGENFKKFLEREDCQKQYRRYMRIFRDMEWLICEKGKFSTVQKIDGKPRRVISIDYEKYTLIKELCKSEK